MHSDGRVYEWITVRQANAHFEVRRPVAGADRHHMLDARGESALDHGLAVVVELFAVQMTVRVDHRHDLLQPRAGRHVFEEAASTGMSPSRDAATIMPCDSMPRSLRGARLATITTFRPTSSSGL